MNEESQIISNDVKSNDLKSILLNNKKSVICFLIIILLSLFAYFFYADYKKDQKLQISQQYNSAVINYNKNNSSSSISEMKIIINLKDPTYSPLALYFLLDNNLLNNNSKKQCIIFCTDKIISNHVFKYLSSFRVIRR